MDEEYPTHGFVSPRPVRVAYFVEDGESVSATLDAIFAECHARWGGRYTLVVPCENTQPKPQYLPWLTAYDPDVIYSYVDFDQGTVRDLHERIGPSYLLRHQPQSPKDAPRDRHFFRPNLPINALSSLSVAPQYGKPYPISAPQPMFVVDYLPGQPSDRFIGDNFGSYYESYQRWPLPEQLTDSVQAVVLASDERLKNPHGGGRHVKHTAPDLPSLLLFMSKNRNSFGVSQLAADWAPRLAVRHYFDEAFSLVVGNTFADRLMFWNQRSFTPTYLGRHFTTLIVEPDRLVDESLFNAIVEFLKSRNGVSRSQGTPWVTLRSASLSSDELDPIRKRLNAADRWNGYHLEHSKRPNPMVPSQQALDDAPGLVMGGPFDQPLPAKEVRLSKETTVTPVRPKHLEELPSSIATAGVWALDLQLNRPLALGEAGWLLPRRLRFHGAFKATRVSGHSRTNNDGHLTVFTKLNDDPPVIVLPDNETAFRHAIEKGHDWQPFDGPGFRAPPTGAYALSRTSDKGAYFLGATRLFGGVEQMVDVLLHEYWRGVFEGFGASIGDERLEEIKTTLRKRLRGNQSLTSEEDWDRVARVVAKTAREVRIPRTSVDLAALRQRHQRYVEQEAKLLEERQTNDAARWLARADASLGRAVQNLSVAGILQQGYEWRCRQCFHTNWHSIGSLEPELQCEACGDITAAPVDRPWDFRLHGFMLEALKEHGLLPLVWAVDRLRDKARQSFYFLPPHDFFSGYPEDKGTQHEGEADLLCVVDKRFYLVEAKSSVQGVDVSSLLKVALKLRPDVVVLAIMEPASSRIAARFEELKRGVSNRGIEAELLVKEVTTDRGSAYLA